LPPLENYGSAPGAPANDDIGLLGRTRNSSTCRSCIIITVAASEVVKALI